MTSFAPIKTVEELDHRASNGVAVWLLWNRENNAVSVVVSDDGADDTFTLDVAPDQALDAFNHPYAYAASHGYFAATAVAASAA
jgi:hypothetical protein